MLTLSVALLFSGCDFSCLKSKANASADAGSLPGRVEMLNRGREPRVKLELGRWTGFSYQLLVEGEGSFGMQGQVPLRAPTTVATLRFEVLRGAADPIVRSRDGLEMHMIEERARVSKIEVRSADFPQEVVQKHNQLMAQLVGTTTRQLVSEDAEIVEMKTELVGGAPPTREVKQMLDAAWDAQRRFPFRLPPEPVGVGAKWRFGERIEVRGVQAMQIADMTVLSVNLPRVRIRVRLRHHAPRQEMPDPIRPKETVMLEQYRGDGDGEVVIDQKTGVILDARLTTTATLRITSTPAGARQTTTFVAVSSLRSRGEIGLADGMAEDAQPRADADEDR